MRILHKDSFIISSHKNMMANLSYCNFSGAQKTILLVGLDSDIYIIDRP